MFSILFDVAGFTVLDLFAGSGAIGLEAISRGAARTVFVEKARAALDALHENIEALGAADRVEVRAESVATALSVLQDRGDRFDLIFADPPWAEAEALLEPVRSAAPILLSEEGRLVLEHAERDTSPLAPDGLVAFDHRRYGDTALSFYGRTRT